MLTTAFVLRFNAGKDEKPEYSVTFHDLDGNELIVRKVRHGDFAIPPDNLQFSANQAFLNWGNPLYPARDDVSCYPSIDDVSDGTNVFFVNTMYIQKGNIKQLQLQIGGQVALDELEIELHYNSRMLKYKSAFSTLGNVKTVKKGVVRFTLKPGEILDSPCALADIEFKAVGKAFTYGEFALEVNTAQINSTPATFERIKTHVFIYKP